MKSGIITASYLDPLAVRIESIRPGKAKGWRRFLVFTALTKGRKGSEYVALFTYFSFEGKVKSCRALVTVDPNESSLASYRLC